ncbi:MAG TPA: ornithine carbamoyltransferase [Methanosarcinales archaeon]|nr:ornithine carbamoyltransferase [Methanosarcinales archaeon]
MTSNPKHLLSISDLSKEEIYKLLYSAKKLKEKRMRKKNELLKNKSLAMIFEKPSTRTRVSFEVAMTDLGGHALYLSTQDLQLGRGETIGDTAQVLSRYVHGIVARVYSHNTLVELSKNATVPVINALSDLEHPCQLLSDLLTIQEFKKKDFKELQFAWIGDGNNVCNSAILACAITGMSIKVACPEGYEPNKDVVAKAKEIGGSIAITNDPIDAAHNADVLYTDVWVSMGDEAEKDSRLQYFKDFQINFDILSYAKSDAIVMHCLPAHYGEEITLEVMDKYREVILEQAENRLHAQKAILQLLLGVRY